jgi:hypothetical protein
MKAVSEIRLKNLETLVLKAGTAEALAERADLSPVYLSQIRSRTVDRKTGKPRNLGSKAARQLEIGMSKPTGWMDADHESISKEAHQSSDIVPHDKWPFHTPFLDYHALSEEKKEYLEQIVASFFAGATCVKGSRVRNRAA